MRKGQLEHIFPELIFAVIAIVVGYILVGVYGIPEQAINQEMVNSNAFSQQFDDYFAGYLQTPVPHSSAFPGYTADVYEYLDGKGYTAGDLIFQALEDADERDAYLETFRHYLYVTYNEVNDIHFLTLRFTFPDGTVNHVGDLIDWRDHPPRSSFVLPYKNAETILVEATGWLN